ncbi:uncharacterized protein At5g39865-like [Lolium rigidum]|uniref:uncharacterized protein At5g39865-like n=1 Tax=Lolium rigidum TaxID=89674 RepID=UPI001F5C13D3|nr:uncharacterized protein At5g39865-like [Lolium rigidum]
MGCASSTFLEDDDRRIIGVSASSSSHIVSLTSSTYGILTYNPTSDAPTSTPPPPPPPPPPSRSKPKPPADAPPEDEPQPQPEAEVINSWELMAGLHDPTTPAKPKPTATASPRRPTADGKPPRCIRFPLRPIDGNTPRPAPTPTPPAPRCPPGGAHCAVLYTTTLRALRDTFEACNAARAALHAHGVAFRERDLSMDRGFRDELRALLPLPLPLTLPRLFVRGRHVGGAEEVLRMDEEGALGPLLHGLPRARPGGRCCDGCGGMRFLPCFDCSGSRKVVVAAAAGAVVKGRRERGVLLRCGECNENGLVLCPICS